MLVDPNKPINATVEHVLVEADHIELFDGRRVSARDMESADNAFVEFCRELDPNRCFISAFLAEDGARDIFFQARDAASKEGIHMQATVEEPTKHRQMWHVYRKAKAYSTVESEDEGSEE